MALTLGVALDCPNRKLRTIIAGSEILVETIDVSDIGNFDSDTDAFDTVADRLRQNLKDLVEIEAAGSWAEEQNLVDRVTTKLSVLSLAAVTTETAGHPSEKLREFVSKFCIAAEQASCGHCVKSSSCRYSGIDFHAVGRRRAVLSEDALADGGPG